MLAGILFMFGKIIMERKLPHFVSGLALYLLFAALVGVATVARISLMSTFSNWLSTSYDPRTALLFFSLLVGGLIMIFFRIGVEFPFYKISISDDVRRYIAGLPMWVLFLLVTASALGLWKYAPACQAPEAVYFEIVGTSNHYQPMGTLEVQPGQMLSIAAKSSDANAQFSCLSWEFNGPAFENMGEKSGCQVNVKFSERPGASFITLVSAQNFCSQKSVFSLEVRVVAP